MPTGSNFTRITMVLLTVVVGGLYVVARADEPARPPSGGQTGTASLQESIDALTKEVRRLNEEMAHFRRVASGQESSLAAEVAVPRRTGTVAFQDGKKRKFTSLMGITERDGAYPFKTIEVKQPLIIEWGSFGFGDYMVRGTPISKIAQIKIGKIDFSNGNVSIEIETVAGGKEPGICRDYSFRVLIQWEGEASLTRCDATALQGAVITLDKQQ